MRTAHKTELNNWNQEFKNINHKNRKYLIKTYGCQKARRRYEPGCIKRFEPHRFKPAVKLI